MGLLAEARILIAELQKIRQENHFAESLRRVIEDK